MVRQPTGTVTLLFTDIDGSTRLLERLGAELYRSSLELHQELLREAFARHDGYEVDVEGDAFFVAFSRASDAVAAARDSQLALAGATWPEGEPIRIDVHKAARIMAAGHGGTGGRLCRDTQAPRRRQRPRSAR